jgi:hypothetical protein
MYRENYINSLRAELVGMVADKLTPVALRYGYSEVPLEANIKWRPLVLVLGNYSSGKSTLINEFLGAKIQATGQAPTDDSFTVITYDGVPPPDDPVRITEERDGKFLLSDASYPFETLKKHGQRFASHFRLKKINSEFLKHLAIIDTPGMVDSISERDRGYDFQEVIGDLAQIADLVLVLFDPHKAGTIREAHESLRDTLPARTFEDRVLFVLNRIDECTSLVDLLRVYGTLCWNLSQMTGRKDIPMIHLTYSPAAVPDVKNSPERDMGFLRALENQREELKKSILQAPRYRLDHLASFVETHSDQLSHFLEALINYRKRVRKFRFKYGLTGLLLSGLLGGGATLAMMMSGLFVSLEQQFLYGLGGIAALLGLLLWVSVPMKRSLAAFHANRLKDLDGLTPLENQTRRDSWAAVRGPVDSYLKKTTGRFSLKEVKHEYRTVRWVCEKGTGDIREALNELSTIDEDDPTPQEQSV